MTEHSGINADSDSIEDRNWSLNKGPQSFQPKEWEWDLNMVGVSREGYTRTSNEKAGNLESG